MDYIPVTPSASCLIESLREIGYLMGTAVADIIDNNIGKLDSHKHSFFME